MIKRFLVLGVLFSLAGCVSEPVDPAFVGTGAIDKAEAAKTRVSLGLTYLKNGNFSQAKTNLDKALEFAPRSGEAHYAMAYYFQRVGEDSLAKEYYENALTFSRNAPDVVNSYGVFLCQRGVYEQAREFFLEAVQSRSYSATAETYENLAICSQSQGDVEGAIKYFNSALNHQPTRARSLYLLADLYTQKERWEEAKKTLWRYERNAQVSPDSLFLNYRIAQGMNDTTAAIGYGDLLVQMFPQHDHAKTFLSEMGKFKPAARVTRKLRPTEPTIENEEVSAPVENVQPVAAPTTNDVQEVVSTLPPDAENATNDADLAKTDTTPTPEPMKQPDAPVQEDLSAMDESEAVTESAKIQADASAPQSDGAEYHVVQPKENLYRISLQYNVKMQKLMDWNNISDPAAIQKGTRLRVKEPSGNDK